MQMCLNSFERALPKCLTYMFSDSNNKQQPAGVEQSALNKMCQSFAAVRLLPARIRSEKTPCFILKNVKQLATCAKT